MTRASRSAHAVGDDVSVLAASLADDLTGVTEPAVIVFFCAHTLDGAELSRLLGERFPQARVLGCTTAGEFTDGGHSLGGVAAIALGGELVARCAVRLAEMDPAQGHVEDRIREAVDALGHELEVVPRELDPERWVGLVLIDSVARLEERVNAALGDAAPLLSFVGGSAGDDVAHVDTRVFLDGRESSCGAVLLLMESRVPFQILKACHFSPTERSFVATRSDEDARVVYELDGRPAPEVYAEAIGSSPDALDFVAFFPNPLGVVIEGQPWLRSIVSVTADGGLFFACGVPTGTTLHLMRGDDIVHDTHEALARARAALGGEPSAGLFFNCVHRRAEVQQLRVEEAYHAVLSGFPLAGFHTHGESWLGHMNQTLTGIVFARADT